MQQPEPPPSLPAVLKALAEQGPLTAEALAQRLSTDVQDIERTLSYTGHVHETDDGWYHLPTLAEGTVLTHLVSADELELGILNGSGDLDLWSHLADEGLPFAGGGMVRVRYAISEDPLPAGTGQGLLGPEGWLDGIEEGQVVAVALVDGALAIEPMADFPMPNEGQLDTLLTAAQQVLTDPLIEEDDPGPGVFLHNIIVQALLADREVFKDPLPPLTVVLALAGLEVHRGYAGLPGTEWEKGDPDELDPGYAVVRTVLESLAQQGTDDVVEDGRLALSLLAEASSWLVHLGGDLLREDRLHAVVRQLAAVADTDAEQAAAAYLLAVLAEYDCQLEQAQEHLDRARELMPYQEAATQLAGEYAAERGQAQASDRLFKEAGDDAESGWRWPLREFLSPPPSSSGRNRPCPCGSGHKHKLCCGRTELHPLPRRAIWRYRRAMTWAQSPENQYKLYDLADILAGPDGDEDAWEQALYDPLLPELLLFEEGRLETYLQRRGPLMEPDERALVEQWRTIPLSVYEVVATRPGRDAVLKALPDGEPVTVADKALASNAERLDLLLGRLLPDGAGVALMNSPLGIPRTMRERVLAAVLTRDAAQIAAALAPAPSPELRNRENEPLLMCSASYALPEGAWELLGQELEESKDGNLVEHVDIKGDKVVRGWLKPTAEGLLIETNSIPRLERFKQRVEGVGGTLLEETATPMEIGPGKPGPGLNPDLPVDLQLQLLEDLGHKYEKAWLDDNIPALDGMTPRDAAADPVMRPRLEALLDDFAWQERNTSAPATMQSARLRAALGLES